MITDRETNFVYFSSLLRKNERYLPFWNRLEPILIKNNIDYGFIENTRDIWCCDYMPIQTGENDFVQFEFFPDYYLDQQYISRLTIPSEVRLSKQIQAKNSKLIVDGGNIVRSNTIAILTDKVLSENAHLSSEKVMSTLKKELGVEKVFLIPKIPFEISGHSDGMIRFLSETDLLVADYSNESKSWRRKMENALLKTGLNIIPYPAESVNEKNDEGNYTAKGVYLNFVQIGNFILLPQFGLKTDQFALERTQELFPTCNVIPIDSNEIAQDGGVLNCITWNIKTEVKVNFNTPHKQTPSLLDQEKYIYDRLDFYLSTYDYLLITKGFEIAWKESTGEFKGDGDFKNMTYHFLDQVTERNPIPQEIVDLIVDLILDYMTSIGQYGYDISPN